VSPVLQTMPLGFQWPTIDPFLFCVHHLDHYPAGTAALGPAASLAGRDLGQDFEPRDGWRMYHGQTVPGFPAHPHRGFETVTFVRQGRVDHADSLGAAARYGGGDVQWMTAGGGIVHAEMFPLLDQDGPNPLELFQIWLNLPAAAKAVEPHFTMFWSEQIPRHVEPGVTVTVIAGALGAAAPLPPPPASWAADPRADVAIWHVVLEPGAGWALPPVATTDTARTLYLFQGAAVHVGDELVSAPTGVAVDPLAAVAVRATNHTEFLMLQGRPIGEAVAQYGPFVMNTQAEIRQAFEDYQRTRFGGWPWDREDPVHGTDPARFALGIDGIYSVP
jgi:redox-sensitive bicupin YhaK (pirin superfamily)